MDFMDFNFGGAGFLVVTITYPDNCGDKKHYWLD